MESVLAARNLCKSYQDGPKTIAVLSDIQMTVNPGEMLAIVGSSGSGKSTLLNVLGGLDTPSAGEVYVAGRHFSAMSATERGHWRNRYIGFVYQFHHLLHEFTAVENVAMPLLIGKVSPEKARSRALSILAAVNLSDRVTHKPSALSGGERQRVAIARALVTEPACVLMDEPTGNLDAENATAIHELMIHLNQQYATSFIIVTHDSQLAARMGRTLSLSDGCLEPIDASVESTSLL